MECGGFWICSRRKCINARRCCWVHATMWLSRRTSSRDESKRLRPRASTLLPPLRLALALVLGLVLRLVFVLVLVLVLVALTALRGTLAVRGVRMALTVGLRGGLPPVR